MKNLTYIIAALIIVFTAADFALAGDSASFGVSCVIPAIPGVNAPPYPVKEESKKTGDAVAENEEKTETNQKNGTETEDESYTFIVQEDSSLKTIYVR